MWGHTRFLTIAIYKEKTHAPCLRSMVEIINNDRSFTQVKFAKGGV